jgi:hypothetical protein
MFPSSSRYSIGTKEKVLRQFCFFIFFLSMFPSSSYYSTGAEDFFVDVSFLLLQQYQRCRESVERVLQLLLLYYFLVDVSFLLSPQYRH